MIHPHPKKKRVVCREYLDFVKSHPCCVFHQIVGPNVEADAHHLLTKGAGGSDFTAIPLCRVAHSEYHSMGKKRFEEKYGVDVWYEVFLLMHEWFVEMEK